MNEYILEIEGLHKKRNGFELKDVSLRIPYGFVMGMIGANGAGKTTIIKLILNLLRRDSGSIRLFGRDILENEVEIKERIGFVLDRPPYYDDISLRANARIVSMFYRKWNQHYFDQLLEEFDLSPRKKFGKLSQGQKMKFGLAVALSHDADLILMDEPTAGLDPVFRRELLERLGNLLLDDKKSVLFSTHITSDLEKIADYITFVHDGEVVFSATREEVGERWCVVKGGRELLTAETTALFRGHRMSQFGFEALCDDTQAVRSRFGDDVVIERASLEDIMFYLNKGVHHA
ncbi:MAG: ABC transporter ATP-binding protein [Candidatus Cloacimonetes bacterium]|nr:ABC transporter ATP-binding protein [Candidatus Cloacimonadota bacterium]